MVPYIAALVNQNKGSSFHYCYFLTGALPNNHVAVLTVPESQLFAVQQSQPVGTGQSESDVTSGTDVSSVTATVTGVTDHGNLTINTAELQTTPGTFTDTEQNGTPEEPKVKIPISYNNIVI